MTDTSNMSAVMNALSALSGWEVMASLLGIGYIIFASKESLWCWPMAFISTLIYTVLFWDGQLPMQAVLNAYYMGMAVYGFLLWHHHENIEANLTISSWSWQKQVLFLLTGALLSLLTAYYLEVSQTSQSPYLDASVSVFSVINTYLMARKVLQNWLYWIVIDIAAISLYWQTGYYATVVLFAVYTVLAVFGFFSWQKLYHQKNISHPHEI